MLTSSQNPRIRRLLTLRQKSSARRKAGVFVVEGRRELRHCIVAGYEIVTLYVCPEILSAGEMEELAAVGCQLTTVSLNVYAKIAYRQGTEGVVAEVRVHDLGLDDLQLSERPLVVVLESVEKPGNLGAVLRSADAAGADAVIVCDPLTDLYNPNLIRSSIGAIFTVPCVVCTVDECIAFLKRKGVRIFTAQLQDSTVCYDADMRESAAIVMGTESTGLPEVWREAADCRIRIPMRGQLDSLNVSVSAAVLLFEAVRQRQS